MPEFPKPPIESPSLRTKLLGAGTAFLLAAGGVAGLETLDHQSDGPASLADVPALVTQKSTDQHTFAPTKQIPARANPRPEPISFATPNRHKTEYSQHPRNHKEHPHKRRKLIPTPNVKIPTEPIPAAPVLRDLHPEDLTIPPAVSQIMSQDTVQIPAMGCSGFLIRNQAGEPIGIQTAQHCAGVSQHDGNWGTNASGQPIINFDTPLEVETGDVINNLTDIGDISEFAISAQSDFTHDLALGAIGNNSIQDVIANYNQMSPEQVANLQPGDVIYNSSWPQFEGNNSGPRKREEFAMSVLGTATVTTTKGNTLNVLMAAVPESADGAECSYGASGSAGFMLDSNGQPLIVGPLSTFDDFGLVANQGNPAAAAADFSYFENKFGVDLNGYSAVCGFSIGPLSPNSEVLAAANAPEDPYFSPLAILERQYSADFFNPGFTRQVIDGMVVINGVKDNEYIDRPAVYYDPADGGTTLLAWYNQLAANPNELVVQAFLGSKSLQSVAIYSDNDGQTEPSLINSTGAVTVNNDMWPGSPGFTDANGLHFGEEHFIDPLNYDHATIASQSTLNVTNGQISVNLAPDPYTNQAADEAAAVAAFNNPAVVKNIVNGTVALPVEAVINRPYVDYNPSDGSVVIGYSTSSDNGQLDTYYYPSLNDVRFYSDSESDPVSLDSVNGSVDFQADQTGQTYGGYVASNGFTFGQQVVNPPLSPEPVPTYELVANSDGSLSMQPSSTQ